MSPTFEAYQEWDRARRTRFPAASHWIYQSRLEGFKVAEWCPLTGRCHVS